MFLYLKHKKLDKKGIKSHVGSRKTHLANERTFLAWTRTAVAIMSFGFVIEKFSLFLWVNVNDKRYAGAFSLVMSNLLGIVFMGLGAFVGLLSIIRFIRVERDIEMDRFRPSIVIDLLCGLIFLVLSGIILYYVLNWHRLALVNYAGQAYNLF